MMKIALSLVCFMLLLVPGYAQKKSYQSWSKKQVDLVIFSYNRPMQLYAFLESMEAYLKNPHLIHVIYRCTDKRFEKGYKIVFNRFPYVLAHKQGKKAPKDFKPHVLKSVFHKKSKSPYIMFAVDDIIMTDSVDLAECTAALKKHKSWFFSLRLGKNITHNSLSITTSLELVPIGIPNGQDVGGNMFKWKFTDPAAKGSWNYPNSVDVTIYRKKDIKRILKKAKYENPNMLESEWHWNWQPKNKKGLCFHHSKAVNLPLNVVNPYWTSANINISAWQLLEKFLKGEKIDIGQFHKIKNTAPHMPYVPTFIKQNEKPVASTTAQLAPSSTTSDWIKSELQKLGN